MPRLTVLIPCKNEITHIRECIESVRVVADEILVADSGSTDGTLEAVRSYRDCRLIQREFVNYASFKNWAIPQAKHEWVLIVDADERVTAELAHEIHSLLEADPSLSAYALQRDNFFLGRPIRHCGWNRSYITRLLRKSDCRYGDCRVHEEVEVAGDRIGRLRGKLLHYTCTDFPTFVERQVRYSLLSAQDRIEAGAKPSLWRTLVHGPFRFLQLYFLRGGFRDGFAGLVLCMLLAFYAFLKDAHLWALSEQQRPSPEFQGYVSGARNSAIRKQAA